MADLGLELAPFDSKTFSTTKECAPVSSPTPKLLGSLLQFLNGRPYSRGRGTIKRIDYRNRRESQREREGKSDRDDTHGFFLRKNELFRSICRCWDRVPMAKLAWLNSPASSHRVYKVAAVRGSDFPLYAIN